MATDQAEVREQARGGRQAGTPSGGNPRGADLRSVAGQIEGLLDDDGQFNPNPDEPSRAHPDYDESLDPRNQPRDAKGRFQSKAGAPDADDDTVDDLDEAEQTQLDDDDFEDDEQQQAADTDESDDDEALSDASDDASTDEADTDDPDAIRTLAELATALDVTVDELKESITHDFRAADEDVTVTLAELEKGYQKDADYRRSTAQLAEYRRAIEADLNTRQQAYETQQHVAAANLNLAEQMLAAELNSPQLAALRESAPDEWTARRTEIGERIAYLQNARGQAAAAYEQFRQNNLAQLREREMSSLQTAVPEFSQQHADLAKQVIGSLGFTPKETSEIFDSRLVLGALELGTLRTRVAELEAQVTKAGETAKRVKKDIPKIQKPGKQISPQAKGRRLQRDNVKRLQGRLRKTGKVEDAAAVIETML